MEIDAIFNSDEEDSQMKHNHAEINASFINTTMDTNQDSLLNQSDEKMKVEDIEVFEDDNENNEYDDEDHEQSDNEEGDDEDDSNSAEDHVDIEDKNYDNTTYEDEYDHTNKLTRSSSASYASLSSMDDSNVLPASASYTFKRSAHREKFILPPDADPELFGLRRSGRAKQATVRYEVSFMFFYYYY